MVKMEVASPKTVKNGSPENTFNVNRLFKRINTANAHRKQIPAAKEPLFMQFRVKIVELFEFINDRSYREHGEDH